MNQGERKLFEFLQGMSGSFYTRLFQAIQVADGVNTEKLRTGFPEEVEAHVRYVTEDGYASNLEKRYKEG